MSEVNPYEDRVLHMRDNVRAELEKVRVWAREKGIEDRLDKGLEYLRTFGQGPEGRFESHLSLDIPWRPDDPCFICTVVAKSDGDRHYWMTLGMVWRSAEQDWTFHS